MFKETPRYMGFPNQIWVESKLAFRNFEMMFKGISPFFVSHYRFKDPDTPIVDNMFFDIDSYYSVRFPYRNSKHLRHWAYSNDIPYFTNFSVTGDREVLVRVDDDEIKLISIKEAIDNFKEGKFMESLSYNKNGKVVFSPIYDCLEHDEKIYRIYHEQSTLPLKLTKYHSIYKWDNSEIVKVKKQDIKKGDFLVTFNQVDIKPKDYVTINQTYTYYNKKKTESISITDSLLRLMGYYVAEGHTIQKSGLIALSFNINETEYHKEVKEAILQLEPARLSKKEKINIREQSPHESVKSLQFNSKKYLPFFTEQCGTTQEHRHVPSFLFNMSKEKFLIFLTAYLNGDGSYRKKYNITAKTISKRLAVELTWLCKIHGISCSIRKNDYREKRPEFNTKIVYIIDINKKDLYRRSKNNKYHPDTRNKLLPIDALKKVYYQCKPKDFINHRTERVALQKDRANHQRIKNIINWFDVTKSVEYNTESKRIINNYRNLLNSDIGFLKVKEVTNLSNESHKVYDISVVDAENFFCGPYPILHKNSGGKGYHNFLFFKPIIPKNKKEYDELKDILYSLQMKIAEEVGLEAFDEPTFGRLRFLVRYPTSKYVRKDEDTGAFTSNGFYCRYLTDKEFDLGVKKLSKVAKTPGIVPRKPRTSITLDDIIDCFDDFEIIKRAEKKRKGLNLNLKRNGNIKPSVQALGLPCLQEIVQHPHPTHYERIELVAWLKHLGYTDLAINAFIQSMNWTRYKYSVTSYQIRTVKPRMVKCSFLRKSYKHLCQYCPFQGRH